MNVHRIIQQIREASPTDREIACLADELRRLAKKPAVSVEARVAAYLQSLPRLEAAGRDTAAGYLNMSPRTLSRKLRKEGTGFHAMLNAERKRRCCVQMKGGVLNGQELVEALGMSDLSHFYKCFRQWTGRSFSEAKTLMAENHRNIDRIFHRQGGKVPR